MTSSNYMNSKNYKNFSSRLFYRKAIQKVQCFSLLYPHPNHRSQSSMTPSEEGKSHFLSEMSLALRPAL